MTQKTKRKKKSKKLWILLVLLIFGVITVIGLYQSQQQPANIHFEIVSAGWEGPPPELKSNGSVAIIYGISVTFKVVGGDAHQVVVESWVDSEPEELGTMLKDTPKTVLLYALPGYLSRKEENGYPVEIRIKSLETGTEKLTFYVTI